jgi:hypothetical protein
VGVIPHRGALGLGVIAQGKRAERSFEPEPRRPSRPGLRERSSDRELPLAPEPASELLGEREERTVASVLWSGAQPFTEMPRCDLRLAIGEGLQHIRIALRKPAQSVLLSFLSPTFVHFLNTRRHKCPRSRSQGHAFETPSKWSPQL